MAQYSGELKVAGVSDKQLLSETGLRTAGAAEDGAKQSNSGHSEALRPQPTF